MTTVCITSTDGITGRVYTPGKPCLQSTQGASALELPCAPRGAPLTLLLTHFLGYSLHFLELYVTRAVQNTPPAPGFFRSASRGRCTLPSAEC